MAFQDKNFTALIVVFPLFSPLKNRVSSRTRVIKSRNAVHYAVEQEGHRGLTAMVMNGQCFQRYVPNVVSELRYHFNHVRVDRYIAGNATIGSGQADKSG
jgi:hypothetical protein